MAKFVCSNCNYKGDFQVDMSNKKCPYCDEKKLTKEQSAEELLKDE